MVAEKKIPRSIVWQGIERELDDLDFPQEIDIFWRTVFAQDRKSHLDYNNRQKIETITEHSTMQNLIPKPVEAHTDGGVFSLSPASSIYVEPAADPELTAIGQYLAGRLKPATGFPLMVLPAAGAPPAENIYLTTAAGHPALGEEGYELTITRDLVTLSAYKPAGLFRGAQTILQLLLASIEAPSLQSGLWILPTGKITDYPRFAWRGFMLDVARHFFSVAEVKRIIDLAAFYKLNRLHLHLSDDQGWRLEIKSWPKLATLGGSTAVDNDPGGYYTQADYAEIVAYAQARYIIVVPEFDMPGHTNAALASYPELNCDGVAPALYTGTEVGFSSLCTSKAITYRFVDDVIREVAALTPGPYIHIGGDEAAATQPADYQQFVERVQDIVQSHRKQMVGWGDIASTRLSTSSIAQSWSGDVAAKAIPQGARVIISTASKAYLDMKYDDATPLGLQWAGNISVEDAYTWDPATQVAGVSEADILGVEAPLWSETLRTIGDIEYMAFPRLPGIAEIGWSPAAGRRWDEYRLRLAAQGKRMDALGVNFYRAPEIKWE
jgi:hexosaminidase